MNNQRGLALMIIVLVIIVLLSGGFFVWKYFTASKEEANVPKEEISPLPSGTEEDNAPEEEGLILPSNVEETNAPEEELPLLSNIADCSKSGMPIAQIITGPFRSVDKFDSAGEATLSGYVVIRDGINYFEEKKIEKVYLKIAPQSGNTPQANFYSYFIGMIKQGNQINFRENDNLFFSLGELTDNGNVFSSTADISPIAKTKILSAMKTGELISLRMRVPIWEGMGAPSDFSFACAVEFSED